MRSLTTFVIENGRPLFSSLFLVAVVGSVLLFSRRGRRAWLRRGGGALCGLLAAIFGFGFFFTYTVNRALEMRTAGFSFRLVSDGSPHKLSDYRGSVVVLNFWATWCPPCHAEMPDLKRLAELHRQDGVVVVAVSDEKLEKLREAADVTRGLVSGCFQSTDPGGTIEQIAYKGRPTTILIDRSGRVRDILIGQQSLGSFEAAVRKLL